MFFLAFFAGTNEVNHMFDRVKMSRPLGEGITLSSLFDSFLGDMGSQRKEGDERGKQWDKTNTEVKRERKERERHRSRSWSSCSGPPSIFGCAHAPAAVGSKYGHWQGTSSRPLKNTHTVAAAAAATQAEHSGGEQSREEPNVFGTGESLRLQDPVT